MQPVIDLKMAQGQDIQPILDRALGGERLSAVDCTALLESYDVARMGAAADEIRRRRHPDNIVTYIIDRNINYTNVCNVVCTFCAFYRRPGAPDTYVRTIDEICAKIDETIALGGTGVLMQGGLHPDFGIEWYEHLVRHLDRIRDLQDETGGFFAFIPWTFQRENTALGRKIKDEPTGIDYLKMLSVSRLYLDNIENFQSSWLTQGLRLGQVALRFGANDMGSIMIEENVVSAAGAHNRADEKTLRYLIREAGFLPQQRDILYRWVHREELSAFAKVEDATLTESSAVTIT